MVKKIEGQRLEDILSEAETSEETEGCVPCKVAAGIGITRSLCEEFKEELDCRELVAMIDNPDVYSLAEVEEAIEKISKNARGKPRELLNYTLCLMKGECRLDEAPH